MSKSRVKDDIVVRVRIVMLFAMALAVAILLRTIYLKTFEYQKWKEKESQITERIRIQKAQRGDIRAIDGRPMATSVPMYELRYDPLTDYQTLDFFKKNIDSLAMKLATVFTDKDSAEWSKYLRDARSKKDRFLLIKDLATYTQLEKVRTFPVFKLGKFKGGFMYVEMPRRIYPHGPLARRLIGSEANTKDGRPGYGLELAFNDVLKGENGQLHLMRIYRKYEMEINDNRTFPSKPGDDLITTIDLDIQDVAQNALLKQLTKYKADWGTAILMEVKTGQIRAMVNLMADDEGNYYEGYNDAVLNVTEPGSTFKLMSMLAALEDGYVNIYDSVDTKNGVLKLYDFVITDTKEGGYGKITVKDAFVYSSNVGIASVMNKYYSRQPARFLDRIYSLKLNQPLGISLGGEGKPFFMYPTDSHWSQISLAQMSIGYEVKLTALQTLAFYNAVANNGTLMRPYFVKEISRNGKIIRKFEPEVIHPSIATSETLKKLQQLLEGVVEYGTASNLKNKNYKIAGKTGTAKIYDEKLKHYVNKYKASFVGYFPADNPIYTCFVMIYNPNELGYYGSVVAGPVFKEIADKVYATHYEFHPQMEIKEQHAFVEVPYSKNGSKEKSEFIFNKLMIPIEYSHELKSEWITTQRTANSVVFSNRFIKKKLVPNVIGMGARDAVYILEQAGFIVSIIGRGSVVQQSVKPDSPIVPGRKIVLRLGHA